MSPNQSSTVQNPTKFHRYLSHFCLSVVIIFFSHYLFAQPVPATFGKPELNSPPLGDLTTLSARTVQTIEWRTDLTHAVFYRPSEGSVSDPVRIFIAGAYHATLTPGTFTELCLPAGTYVIQLGDSRSINSVTFSQSTDLLSLQSHFFRVNQKAGEKTHFLETRPEQALQEASTFDRIRTLTRVSLSQNCRPRA